MDDATRIARIPGNTYTIDRWSPGQEYVRIPSEDWRVVLAFLEATAKAPAKIYEDGLRDAAAIAENPGFIEAADNSYDDGVNDAKRIIAAAIRAGITGAEPGTQAKAQDPTGRLSRQEITEIVDEIVMPGVTAAEARFIVDTVHNLVQRERAQTETEAKAQAPTGDVLAILDKHAASYNARSLDGRNGHYTRLGCGAVAEALAVIRKEIAALSDDRIPMPVTSPGTGRVIGTELVEASTVTRIRHYQDDSGTWWTDQGQGASHILRSEFERQLKEPRQC